MAKRKNNRANDFPTKKELEEVFGAKKQKPKPEKKEEFFVSIHAPTSIRVSLLESRKLALHSMKIFQALKQIRTQKITEQNKLRKQLKQIYSTINKLKSSIPYVKLPPEKPEPVKKEEPVIKEEPVKEAPPPKPIEQEPEKPKPLTEVDRIEAELADIEDKLTILS